MRLIELRLRNFKGVKNFTFHPGGKNATISGRNGTGKTTVADGCSWLLFDKDSLGNKQFSMKTLDGAGGELHNLEHEVTGIFIAGNKQIELQKTTTEKWTKKRGSASPEFTGHTTEYHVDGVPVKLAQYKEAVASIADEQVFQLLTSPLFFPGAMHWTKRRALLMEICGDVTDADVIASSADLAPLDDILANRSFDSHRMVVAERRKKINKELETIPVRVDEVDRGMPDLSRLDLEELKSGKAELLAALAGLKKKKDDIFSGAETAELRRQRSEIQTKISDTDRGAVSSLHDALAAARKKRDDLAAANNQARNAVAGYQDQIKNKQAQVDELEKFIATLKQQWFDVAKTIEPTCPTCGQEIPAEKISETIKAEKARINDRGKKEAATRDEIKGEIAALNMQISQTEKTIDNEREISLGKEIEELAAQVANRKPSKVVAALKEEEEALSARISDIEEKAGEAAGKVASDIMSTEMTIGNLQAKIDLFAKAKDGEKRKRELAAEQKRLAAEFEKLEGELFLLDQFTRAKVNMLEDKINGRFKIARFKMFSEQINGGLSDCCEVICNGVPFSTGLNHGHQILVGLDIINTLSEFYKVSLPCFIDNAEAITEPLPDMPGQVIRLWAKVKISVGDKVMSKGNNDEYVISFIAGDEIVLTGSLTGNEVDMCRRDLIMFYDFDNKMTVEVDE